jgi:hypothetical protein
MMIIFLYAAGIIVLYRHLAAKPSRRALWRSAVKVGFSVGIARAVLSCIGWYAIERTGGPLQIPAFALAMLAWPEAVLFGRHRGSVPLQLYVQLSLLLIVTSLLLVGGIALSIQLIRSQRWTTTTTND